MTEAEWLACDDPGSMLDFLGETVSSRKLRLFAVASCRRAANLLDRDHNTLQVAEQYADGQMNLEDFNFAWWDACEQHDEATRLQAIRGSPLGATLDAVWVDNEHCGDQFDLTRDICRVMSLPNDRAVLVAIIRDLIGLFPFRAITSIPNWRTELAHSIAQGIYADRAFDRLPILADALEDAGCDNRDILDHCRQPGEHVRGCWVVDLVLGKE